MSRKRRLTASVFALVTAFSFAVIGAPPGAAATTPISFQFTTVVDATAVGGSSSTPMRVIYQFNPDLAPGSGLSGSGENFASYGPLEKIIFEVGSQCVALAGAGTDITVFDNAGTTFVEDSYNVRASDAAVAGKTVFGLNLELARFLLVDNQATMFSDTSLPTSPEFADAADFQQSALQLRNPTTNRRTTVSAAQDAPFQLGRFDPHGSIGEIIDEVNALPVSSDLKAKLVAPLEKARTLLEGTLLQKNIKQARGSLEDFIKIVHTNRNRLGQEAAASLRNSALFVIDELPACA
ncbi:hypothetical protein [Pseudarthrobacter sulfonivorans]|uniref:hypothetical protein n=1 Tax=Pseudarthrobacter sulfonivorans TaxID=121292 RepID=UPI00286A820C|nr:hypothetical protein [Pseudarthrobacter sulfonivorans]